MVFGFDNERLNLLLIERKVPGGGNQVRFALPGDLVWEDEGLDEAAARVLQELTRLEGVYLKQFKAFGSPHRVKDIKDLDWLRSYRQQPQARVITVGYYAFIRMDDFKPEASSFAERVFWQELHEIPQLGFDHNQIVDEAIGVLRNDFMNHYVGFELLPEKFTLSQLQTLYESILDKKLDKRNFRKKVLKESIVVPLAEKQKGVLHKPAQLFELNQESLSV